MKSLLRFKFLIVNIKPATIKGETLMEKKFKFLIVNIKRFYSDRFNSV